MVLELLIFPGVVCLCCCGAGEDLYSDPSEEELYGDVDAGKGEGTLKAGLTLSDLEEVR